MKKFGLMLAGVLACCAGGAVAQAPAGAPAGATGICKDGTYSTQATKAGACRGHKGVQTWYAASAATPAAPAATKPSATASAPAATPAATRPSVMPAPTPAASAPASAASAPATGKRLSPAQAAAQKTAAPGGGKGLVWLNASTNVYHCSDDAFYGKTKSGSYLSEADAKAKGAHGVRGKGCAGK